VTFSKCKCSRVQTKFVINKISRQSQWESQNLGIAMYVNMGRKNVHSLKKKIEVKKETKERKKHRETKQSKQKSIYPH